MGPVSVNRAQRPGRHLLLALEFALHYEAVRVVGERTGLQADDVLTLWRPHDADGVGRDHTLLEYLVGVTRSVCVREEDLIPLLQLVEVPEHEVALRPRITNPVARDVDVSSSLPRETRTPHVDDTVVESLLVPALGGVVDGHAVHPIQRRGGEFEPLALRRLRPGAPYRLDNPLRDTPVELLLDLLSRLDTMVDSRTLSPICDISITKRGFVGNGWPSGAQILLRRYNLARESWNTAGGGRGRAQGRARARDRRQARQ